MSVGLLRGVLRLDRALLERVVLGRQLRPVLLTGVVVIVVGCGAYGVAMGHWRSPLQAVGAGIKLPLMVLACAGLTAALDVVLSGLLRARVAPMQALTASVLAMALIASMLGALSPIAAWMSTQVPGPHSPQGGATSDWLLTGHVLALGVVGIVGVARLYGLLRAMIADPLVARRVLCAWMLTHGVVGAQLSWVLRPFVGNPQLPVRVVRAEAFEGSFFEAVLDIAVARMGPVGPLVMTAAIGVVVVAVLVSLDAPIEEYALEADRIRMRRRGSDLWIDVSLTQVCGLARVHDGIRVWWCEPGGFDEPNLVIAARGEAATNLYEALAWACSYAGGQFAYRSRR
ncbi:MAG: hypothetical protein AAGA54_16620 [Myxococcota bacterium]